MWTEHWSWNCFCFDFYLFSRWYNTSVISGSQMGFATLTKHRNNQTNWNITLKSMDLSRCIYLAVLLASPDFWNFRRLCSKYVIPLAPGSFPRKVWEKQSPVTASSKILTNVPSFDFLFAQCAKFYENDLSTKSDKCVKLILVIW